MQELQISQQDKPLTKPLNDRQNRQMGLELLRIIAIFLILCVHLLNAGGFKAHSSSELETKLLGFLDCIFSISVNVFVLISGYFLVNSKFKYKKIISLWLNVLFYSVIFYLLNIIITKQTFNFFDLINRFTPLINRKYWFFSAYALLYLIFPLLNKILHNISYKQCVLILFGIFIVTYLSSIKAIGRITELNHGYNIMWFICLYFIGAIIKLHPPKIKNIYWLTIYIISTLFNWLAFHFNGALKFLSFGAQSCEQYTSILVLFASISIFMLFKSINIKSSISRKVISFISISTFSIYLFDGSDIRPFIYNKIFNIRKFYGTPSSILFVLIFAFAMFVLGLIIDQLRKIIFKFISNQIIKFKLKNESQNH